MRQPVEARLLLIFTALYRVVCADHFHRSGQFLPQRTIFIAADNYHHRTCVFHDLPATNNLNIRCTLPTHSSPVAVLFWYMTARPCSTLIPSFLQNFSLG